MGPLMPAAGYTCSSPCFWVPSIQRSSRGDTEGQVACVYASTAPMHCSKHRFLQATDTLQQGALPLPKVCSDVTTPLHVATG